MTPWKSRSKLKSDRQRGRPVDGQWNARRTARLPSAPDPHTLWLCRRGVAGDQCQLPGRSANWKSRPQAVLPGSLENLASAQLRRAGFRRRVWTARRLKSATSCPSRRARKLGCGMPAKVSFPATNLRVASARPGQALSLTAGSLLASQLSELGPDAAGNLLSSQVASSAPRSQHTHPSTGLRARYPGEISGKPANSRSRDSRSSGLARDFSFACPTAEPCVVQVSGTQCPRQRVRSR